MSINDSVKTCFEKYATFEGRASRSEYWWFFLVTMVLSYVPFFGFVVALATMIPLIAVGVRRLHDTNHSGWWLLCPLYNLVLLATESDLGHNGYGEKPND